MNQAAAPFGFQMPLGGFLHISGRSQGVRNGCRELAQRCGDNQRYSEHGGGHTDEHDETVIVVLAIQGMQNRQRQADEGNVNQRRNNLRPARIWIGKYLPATGEQTKQPLSQ